MGYRTNRELHNGTLGSNASLLVKALYVLFCVIIALVGDITTNYYIHKSLLDAQKDKAASMLKVLQVKVEDELARNLYLVYGMAAYISVRGSINGTEFKILAENLFKQNSSLLNIAAAPDFVITHIYPVKGNEKAIGLDYRKVPDQWQRALAAKETGRMVIAGPVPLVQGGIGLIARVPVFTGDERKFWGLVSSVISIDQFFQKTGIESHPYLSIAIRGRGGTGRDGEIFYGDEDLFSNEENSVTATVTIPYGSWYMAAIPKNGWNRYEGLTWLIHLGYIILGSVIIFLWRQRNARIAVIEENRQQVIAMSRASHDPLVMIDADDNIVFWNLAAEKAFGYSEDEAYGRKLHQLIALQEDKEKAYAGMEQFRRTGTGPILQQVREVDAVRKSGDLFPVELSVSSFLLGGKWHAVGSLRDITERKKYLQQLTQLATTDSLTGILNRRKFMDLFAAELKRAKRYNTQCSILMFDIDHFKSINDGFGHDIGDLVLKAITALVSAELRTSDLFARLGGEEFAVLLPETDSRGAVQLAERMRERICSQKLIPGSDRTVTISIGISFVNESTEIMLKNADTALYEAKNSGRNRVVVMQ